MADASERSTTLCSTSKMAMTDMSTDDDVFSDSGKMEVADDILDEDDNENWMSSMPMRTPSTKGRRERVRSYASPLSVAAVEQDWGAGTFIGLLLSTAMLAVVGLVMFDLIHNIWSYQQPTAASSTVLDALGGLYGKK